MTNFTQTARKALLLSVTALTLLGAPAALASGSEGAALDTATSEALSAKLTAEGYELRKMQMEDGMIEVYAIKDGATYELYFGADLALIKSCTDGLCTDGEGNEVSGADSDEG